MLYVRAASCFGGTEVACNDDRNACQTTLSGKPAGSRIDMSVTAGQTYFVVVDGANGADGDFILTVDPPAGTVASAASMLEAAPDALRAAVIDDTAGMQDGTAGAPPEPTPQATTEPVAHRCWRTTAIPGAARLRSSEREAVDRFAATIGTVTRTTRVCAPVGEALDASDRTVARFRVRRHDAAPSPLARAVHVENALGEVELDVVRLETFQMPATVAATPPDTRAADAPATACYVVRAPDDVPSEWSFDDGTETLALIGPLRLCIADETSPDVRLCYRTRVPPAAPAAVWVTSPAGSERVELSAADEICLPSTLVSAE